MIHRTTLDNGIRVLSEKVPGCHSVSLGVWVNNGSRHEPLELGGISHFIEHMLFKGTGRRSAQVIAREIDSVGGILNGFTSREFSCYYVKLLAEKLPLAVDLLGDLLCNARFDLDDIEKERRVILQEIAMIDDSPEESIHDRFVSEFWADHPLGRPVLGTRASVSGLKRDDMLAFLNRRYVGGNLCVVASGCLEHAALVDLVGQAFAAIPGGCDPLPCSAPVTARRIEVVPRELEQAQICLGVAGLPQDHVDRYGVFLLNILLGGNMSSRLFQKVREELGMAYSIYSYHHNHSDCGSFMVHAGTSAADAPRAVRKILAEMRRLRHESPGLDELQGAKDYLKGSMLLAMESTDNRMTRLAKNELFLRNVGISLEESLAMIDAVTVDLVQHLAETLFVNDTFNLLVTGRVDRGDFPELDLQLG